MIRGDRIIRKNGILSLLIISLIAFIFSINCKVNPFIRGTGYTDSNVFMYVGRVIAKGGIPYKDAFDHKGPLVYLINALAVKIASFGGSIWVFEFVTLLISFYFVYKTSRLSCNKVISLIVLIISSATLNNYFQGGNLTEEYALPFITISTFIFTDYFLNNRINKFRAIICGLSFEVVCMLRINMIALWVVMCVSVLIKYRQNNDFHTCKTFFIWFIVGTLIILLPIMIWLFLNNAIYEYISDYFLFNIEYINSLPQGKGTARRVESFIYFLKNPVIIFAFISQIYISYKKFSLFTISYLCYMVLTLASIAISGRLLDHYGMTLVPMMAVPLQFIGCMQKENIYKPVTLLSFLFILSYTALPLWFDNINHVFQEYSNRNENYYDIETKISDIIVSNTSKEDKIIVCGNWNAIYNLSDRFSASRYSYQNAPCGISEIRKKEFLHDIETTVPKIIVLPHDALIKNDMEIYIQEHNYEKILEEHRNRTPVDVYLLRSNN